jgi:hypothetical protein
MLATASRISAVHDVSCGCSAPCTSPITCSHCQGHAAWLHNTRMSLSSYSGSQLIQLRSDVCSTLIQISRQLCLSRRIPEGGEKAGPCSHSMQQRGVLTWRVAWASEAGGKLRGMGRLPSCPRWGMAAVAYAVSAGMMLATLLALGSAAS